MFGGEVRKITSQEIQLVQNLIEKCLPHYMTQKEVMKKLLDENNIEPTFTELVWKRLEDQNQEFFRAYHLRMMLKEQIAEFNTLLQKQAGLMKQVAPGVSLPPMSNGSHLQPTGNQSAACYPQGNSGAALRTAHMQQNVTSNIPVSFTNRDLSVFQSMPSGVSMPVHSNIQVPPQYSNVGMVNGEVIKSNAGYDSRFMHGVGRNMLGTRAAIGDAPLSVSPFSSVDSDSQPMNESPFDDMSSLALERNFSFSDLAHLVDSSDILDSISGSPFRENLLEPHGGIKEHHGGWTQIQRD